MDVVVLGSGTAVPVPGRFPAGYAILDGDYLALIDLGPGVLRRFADAGFYAADLDAVLLTHYHTDHSADLAALLFAMRNPRFHGRKPLALRGARGLHKLLADIETAWPWCRQGEYELDVVEIEPGSFRMGPLAIEAARIEHTDASLGYRITGSNGKSAAFSGDATYCDGVVAIARDADLFVCDSAFPTDELNEGHMTPAEAGRAAARAGAKLLCLTHFYPECEGFELTTIARTEFDGEIVEARDLLTFHLD